jgi:hypothetical protein
VGLRSPNFQATSSPSEVGRRSLQKLRHSDRPRPACDLATHQELYGARQYFRLIAHRCLPFGVRDTGILAKQTGALEEVECPLYLQKWTLELGRGISALCQKQTLALFDKLVGTEQGLLRKEIRPWPSNYFVRGEGLRYPAAAFWLMASRRSWF